MHTNPPMYNPMMPNHHEDMGDPNHSNFNMNYGAPNYTMPTYPIQNTGFANYGPGNYVDDRNQMPRDRSQEFVPRKNNYGPRNQGHFQKDSHYNRNRPMGNGRNGMNNNGNKFQRGPSRNPRDNDSYRPHNNEGNYHDEKMLPQSRKIMKPMRNPGRRNDGPGPRPHYDDRQSYNSNYSKPFQKRPMRQQPDEDSDEFKGANSLMFFKTKLCPHLAEGGCTRGSHCNYAHTENELRDVPNLKKTKLCQLFMMGKCNRGNMCSFAHGEQELRSTPEFYKTSICNGYLKGSCRAGDNCRYAHGKDELRNKYDVAPSYSTGMPMQAPEQENGNGFSLNAYPPIDSGNVDMSKDPKDSRFIINGNNMHSYINQQMPMDSNPIDPNYLNNNQGPNGVKSSPSNRNDNFSQNPYNPTINRFNNYMPTNNNWDRNVPPANKPVNSQGEHPDNITFHPYNPEKINSLFTTPNENPNFLK